MALTQTAPAVSMRFSINDTSPQQVKRQLVSLVKFFSSKNSDDLNKLLLLIDYGQSPTSFRNEISVGSLTPPYLQGMCKLGDPGLLSWSVSYKWDSLRMDYVSKTSGFLFRQNAWNYSAIYLACPPLHSALRNGYCLCHHFFFFLMYQFSGVFLKNQNHFTESSRLACAL